MGLKGFHVFFIAVATLTALMFGVWGVWDFSRTGKGGTLTLSTHDAGGITESDLKLAEKIEAAGSH